jgi:DNA-binding transcriptional LysR family regulator
MELRTLRAFVEVVRQGGFSQAAKIVFATQSTVSKAVKQLEDELGLPLLDRIGHRSELTAAGEIVYRRALAMLAERDDLLTELEELRGLKRGVLRLGLPLVGSSILFAPAFAAFRGLYPGIDIRLIEMGSKRLEEVLLAGEIDLAVSLLPVSDAFEYQLVRSEPIVALLASGHHLADKEQVDLASLASSPFILLDPAFALTELILAACRRSGITPRIVARSAQIDFIVELVATGLGVAFLPRLIAKQHDHPAVRRALVGEPDFAWDLALIWRRGGYLSHAAKTWLALVHDLGNRADRR